MNDDEFKTTGQMIINKTTCTLSTNASSSPKASTHFTQLEYIDPELVHLLQAAKYFRGGIIIEQLLN